MLNIFVKQDATKCVRYGKFQLAVSAGGVDNRGRHLGIFNLEIFKVKYHKSGRITVILLTLI